MSREKNVQAINSGDEFVRSLFIRSEYSINLIMSIINKRLATANTDHETNQLKRMIDHTDKQIDQLVYELYNLTQDEIKIVKGG